MPEHILLSPIPPSLRMNLGLLNMVKRRTCTSPMVNRLGIIVWPNRNAAVANALDIVGSKFLPTNGEQRSRHEALLLPREIREENIILYYTRIKI